MTVATTDILREPPVNPVSGGRSSFKLTLARYHQFIDEGVFTEYDAVELIFGQLIEKMPVGDLHTVTVDLLTDYFYPKHGTTHLCRTQNPISIPDHSEPEPDFSLVDRNKYNRHLGKPRPEHVDLVIEVADSSIEYDRTTKAALYAIAENKEYWIINLRDGQVEVFLRPNAVSSAYDSVQRFRAGEEFDSPFSGRVVISDLLPDD